MFALLLALGACRDDLDFGMDAAPITLGDAAPSSMNGADAAHADATVPIDADLAEGGASNGDDAALVPGPAPDAGNDAGAQDAAVLVPDAQPMDAASSTLDGEAADAAPDAAATDAARDGMSSLPDAGPSIYDDDSKWLCRPGLPGSPCAQKLEITDVHADGGASVSELPMTPTDVAADCLYLYPTVDPGLLSPPRNLDFPQIDRAAVRDIFFAQAVPFRGSCALYAPLYRQTSLNSFDQQATREKGLEAAYRDLEAAFDYYLRHAAPGRPIVLLAHSQGAMVMSRLVQRRFETDPQLRARLVVAVLAGPLGGFLVPEQDVVGGTFKQIPLCTSVEQTGCVLTYNSFAASAPPNADYTKVTGGVQAGFDLGCTAPPGGSGGSARRLAGALFPIQTGGGIAGLFAPSFDFGSVRVRTRYARLADFYTARCVDSDKGLSYLRITPEPLSGDRRKDPVPYNHLSLNDRALGLHALDYTFVSAELVQAVQTKISAHRR